MIGGEKRILRLCRLTDEDDIVCISCLPGEDDLVRLYDILDGKKESDAVVHAIHGTRLRTSCCDDFYGNI